MGTGVTSMASVPTSVSPEAARLLVEMRGSREEVRVSGSEAVGVVGVAVDRH